MAITIGSLLVELGVNMAGFVDGMDKATYKAKQAGKEIGDAFKGLGKDIGGILSHFGEMGNVIGEALGGAGETIAKLAGNFGSLGGAAGAAAIGVSAVAAVGVAAAAGMGAMAIAGAEVVHELDMVSQKTGIGIKDLEGLKAAGQTVGVGLDAMVTGFRRFDQALSGTGKGSVAAQVTLKALGITATTNKEALEQVAEAFKKMEDGPAKAADAIALFGRTGLNMIPFLNKGKEGLEEFNKLVDEYGPKIGKDAVAADEEYMKSQVKLSLAWDAMKVSLESAVLPVITKMIGLMADAEKAASSLVNELKNHFGETVKNFFKDLSQGGGVGGFGHLAAQVAAHANEQSPEEKAQEELNKKKEAAIALAGQQVKAEMEIFKKIKDGGLAAEKLRETQEEINVDLERARETGESKYVKDAEVLQRTIPTLEKAAKLEKERRDYQLDPKKAVLGADDVQTMITKLDEQVGRQNAYNASLAIATGNTAELKAELEAKAEIDASELKLTNELGKAQQEFDRLAKESGTWQYYNAQAIRDQKETELKELMASKDKIIAKNVELAQSKDAGKIIQGTQAIELEAQAYQVLASAIGGSTAEKIEAAGEAARLRSLAGGGSNGDADLAKRKAISSGYEADADSIAKMAHEQYNLNYQYDQTLAKLEDARGLQKELGIDTLLTDQAIYNEQAKLNKQWDDAAIQMGGFKDKMHAVLDEVRADGQNMWASIAEGGKVAMDGLASEFAKFATTGKASFKSVLQGFEENMFKASFKKVESLASGGIMKMFGLGGGEDKPTGTKSDPVYVQMAGGIAGGGLDSLTSLFKSSGDSGSDDSDSGGGFFGKIFHGIGSFFSSIFHGGKAEGGDVSPGKMYLVGEHHPEFFIPGKSGTIVPTLKTDASRPINMSVHFHGVTDADSFKKSQSQIMGSIHRSASVAMSRGA